VMEKKKNMQEIKIEIRAGEVMNDIGFHWTGAW